MKRRKQMALWMLILITMAISLDSRASLKTGVIGPTQGQVGKDELPLAQLIFKEKEMDQIVKANNNFGLTIYQEFSREKSNQFLSPISLLMALAMTLEGARSETALVINQVLKLPANEKVRQKGFAQIREIINQPGRKSKLSLANAIWVQQDFPVLINYLEVIAQYYDGQANNVDFIFQRETARKTINKWAEEKTAGKIKDLIPPGIIDHLTRLILTNAIYFRGLWLLPFNPEFTRPENFYLTEGQTVEVPMMRFLGEKARFPYMENEDVQMVEIFYEDQDLSMLILLPRQKDISYLENKLTLDLLETWKKRLKEARVDLYLPRFKIDAKYFLKEKLKEMGMGVAFTSQADFSGINGRKDLFIQQVIHQAYIEVNEAGTEAAGATGVLVGRTAYTPEKKYIFRADHPFIFFIQEKTSGVILFLGRLSDPR